MTRKNKNKKKKIKTLEDKLKNEIADELGLTDKIEKVGWAGLTAKESGRIGGLVRVRKKELEAKKKKEK